MDGIHDSIVANNQFVVGLNLDIYSFAKVTNITGKLELETIEEGGYNDSPRMFRKAKTSPDTLILEKGVQTSGVDDALTLGAVVNAGMVLVMRDGSIAKQYTFEYGIITKWETDGLDAMSSNLLIRRIEISHTGLVEV